MEAVLEKNIRNALAARNLSLAELSRLSNVPYRTLQDILALKQAAKITTVAAIAAGLGTTAGKLLEPSTGMETIQKGAEITPEEALEVLSKAIKRRLTDELTSRVARLGPNGRRQLEKMLDVFEAADEESGSKKGVK